ncbi:MAG: hypothetical protein E5299_01755 [Burkholderia gladioli]|nr:MAG: hypothetical protein E5299_01755 [Burkholderia gladioli]
MGSLYNAGLINRGNVRIWIDEAVLTRIPAAILTCGLPCLYGDMLIEALLGVKTALLHKSGVRTQWNGLRTSLVRNPFVSPAIIPVDAIACSSSIYAKAAPLGEVFMPSGGERERADLFPDRGLLSANPPAARRNRIHPGPAGRR